MKYTAISNKEYKRIKSEIDLMFEDFNKRAFKILHWQNWNPEIANTLSDLIDDVKKSISDYLNQYPGDNLIVYDIKQHATIFKGSINLLFDEAKDKPKRVLGAATDIKLILTQMDFWKFLGDTFKNINNVSISDENIQPLPEIKPIFKPAAVKIIFDILKDFFSPEHQTLLEEILKSGRNASEPLVFLDNGNRLADAFKQLIKSDFITGCGQKELEKWISKNFKYRYRKQIKKFTGRYLNDIISTNKDKCQKPLLNVKKDKPTGNYLITKA